MAGKGWTSQVAAAAGIAAGTGAAQLGLGYGLGVVVWPMTPAVDDSAWIGSLGWATWIAASSTVFGAVIAERLRGGRDGRPTGALRVALALAAGFGALLTVALIAVPARSAVRPDTFAPEMTAGGYAVIGIGLGMVVAYWAVVSRPIAANLVATAAYLWALAATGIIVELVAGRDSATYLTSWQFADLGTAVRYGTIYWPSAVLTLLAAFLIGVLAAWPAARRGHLGVGTAASGAVGPLLVAASFLVLAPQLTGALGQLESAYLIAPYAMLAGLAGSAMAVTAGQRAAERRRMQHHRPAPPAATGTAAVSHPEEDEQATVEPGTRPGAEPPAPAGATRATPPGQGMVRGQRTPAKPATPAAQADPPTDAKPAPASSTPRAVGATRATPAGPERSVGQEESGRADRSDAREGRPDRSDGPDTPAKAAKAARAAPPEKGKFAGAKAAKPPTQKTTRSTVAAPPATPTIAEINPGKKPAS
ncbi:MAG TPA: Hansenula MRAKII killer toxin-resistant protein 1 [Actinoplanes sp.]|nr:Hansenula MRAKII killer toxin-resistant protein 1 [Actinoplanes sp.]